MRISVLISCHNYREFVTDAIESALNQTLQPAEIIVVDDGSTDGSGELLQQRYGDHPIVKVIRTSNCGQMATFVTAFGASSGEIVAFLDADDRFLPAYLDRLANVYRSNPVITQVFCNMQMFGDNQGPWMPLESDREWGAIALRMWATQDYFGVPTSGISMRRNLCEEVFQLPEQFHPDWRTRADDNLVFGAGLLGALRYFIGDRLVEYRMHGRNSWAGRKYTPAEVMRHVHHVTQIVGWYGTIAGLDHRFLNWSYLEFSTIPKPLRGEFALYLWFQLRAEMPWRAKARAISKILVHYSQSLKR